MPPMNIQNLRYPFTEKDFAVSTFNEIGQRTHWTAPGGEDHIWEVTTTFTTAAGDDLAAGWLDLDFSLYLGVSSSGKVGPLRMLTADLFLTRSPNPGTAWSVQARPFGVANDIDVVLTEQNFVAACFGREFSMQAGLQGKWEIRANCPGTVTSLTIRAVLKDGPITLPLLPSLTIPPAPSP